MVQVLENDKLRIEVAPDGAELIGLFDIAQNREMLWQADPQYWARRSPVLFPIVGKLKDDRYTYKAKQYRLLQHGFARDKKFKVETATAEQLSFSLTASDETRAVYPFDFRLLIHYSLLGGRLEVRYEVRNEGHEEMLFSIGGHPAFICPFYEGESLEEYVLEFEIEERTERLLLQNGLLTGETEPLLFNERLLLLTEKLFSRDAVVMKNPDSSYVILRKQKEENGLKLRFGGFPYLGIWKKPGAPFVCIEPWQGVADTVNTSGRLEEKEGMILLKAGKAWEQAWSVEV